MSNVSVVPVDHEPDFGSYSLVPVDHNPFEPTADRMIQQAREELANQHDRMRFSDFRRSENIEDRRNDTPIDTHTWPRPDGVLQMPNVFETGHGTMVALDPNKDFYAIRNSRLSTQLGTKDLDGFPPQQSLAAPLMNR